MRKKLFLTLFLAIFSIFSLNFINVSAEDLSVSINVDNSYASYFDQNQLVFSADYSIFNNYSPLSFTVSTSAPLNNASYVWETKSGTIISQRPTLILYKNISSSNIANITNDNLASNLITVGTSTYKFTAQGTYDGQNVKITKSVTVVISQINETYKLSTYCEVNNGVNVTKITNNFNIYTFLPTTKAHTINWYLKTPNCVSYNLIAENTNQFTFNCEELINDTNGYGTYKIYSKATETSTSGNTYISNLLEFNALASEPSLSSNAYEVLCKEVKNSKAKIQAFEYTLKAKQNSINTLYLNGERILWYVNGNLVSSGKSFVYEPTSTDVYNLTVKYVNSDNTITQLGSFRTEPSSTGIGILLLVIVGTVVVLSGILTVSIVITNKKRDVVW